MRVRLSDALSVMLPSTDETLFLRSCLLAGEPLRQAWRGWLEAVGDPLRHLRGPGSDLRRHLPLLYRNLTDNGAQVPAELQPYLRAALVREQLRFARYDRCFGEATSALAAAGIDATVLKGAALARTAFEPSFLRHCHDLDLWVREEAHGDAADALVACGFRRRGRHPGTTRGAETTRLEHPDGLPVLLHARLLKRPVPSLPEDEVLARRRTIAGRSGSWQVLAPPDMLLHVCAHAAMTGRRPHASWAVDAHRACAQLDAHGWQTFEENARRADLALPLAVLLRYLVHGLAAPVPGDAVDALEGAADGANGAGLVAAIDGAWVGRPGGLGRMLVRSGWRSRLAVVRWLALPPAAYLRATRGPMGRVGLAAEYVARPARFVVRELRRPRAEAPRASASSPAVVGADQARGVSSYAAKRNGSETSHQESAATRGVS